MIPFGFAALLQAVEARLVAGLKLEPVSIPLGLSERRGVWKGAPVTLTARAYRSRTIAYARFVTVIGQELEIGNALCLSSPDYPLPILGADLVGFSAQRSVVVADLSPVMRDGALREEQLKTLATARRGRVPLPSAGELPAWCRPWFSSQTLFVRPAPEEAGEVAEAVGDFATAFLAIAASTPRQEEAVVPVAAVQRAYSVAHRDEDKGLGMLAKLFDPEFSRSFIDEVLFPEQIPPWVTGQPEPWDGDRRELALACDGDGRIAWADSIAQRRLGARVGQSFFDLVPPGTVEKARDFLERGRVDHVNNAELAVLAGSLVSTFSFRAKPDGKGGALLLGSDVPEHADAYSHMEESMDELASLHRQVVRQKRELQQKNDELQRASAQVTEVLESISDAFYALDAAWRVVLVNDVQAQEAHLRREDMLGRVFWEVFPATAEPTSQHWAAFHRCLEERVNVQFVTHDASRDLWTSVRVYPSATGGVAVFTRDVSIERRAEAVLKVQADFEQQLIGIVSHDLRSPLSVIVLGSAFLLNGDRLDASCRKTVGRIQSSAASATRLIRDLLDFTKARLGGGIPVSPGPMDLAEVVRWALDEVEAAYPGRELRLQHQGEVRGEWDRDRIAQVVSNLVSNALKYSPTNSPVLITTGAEGGWATLQVHNRGTAIPSELLPLIFQPLQRATADPGTTRSVGLGLYIVKQIADAHRGSIEVRSTEADGTTFTLRLPLT